MPDLADYENKDDWMGACVPKMIDEGKEQSQAVAACSAMWENRGGESKAVVKAVGDWELDVLGVPYGGPFGGKDHDKEYFSEKTNLHLDKFGNPLIVYYHGYTPDGIPDSEPQVIGRANGYSKKKDGVWWRVILDKTSEYARRVWEAAKQGMAAASSGSLSHLVRKNPDGEIINWPVGEISLFDAVDGRQPANPYAVALPVMKAAYARAGKAFPDVALTLVERIRTETDNINALTSDLRVLVDSIDRPLSEIKRNELKALQESYSGFDAVRREIGAILTTQPTPRLVGPRLINHELAERRKRLAEILED